MIAHDPGDRRPQHRALRAGVMDKPFAITLDVGSSLANKTGAWRDERPVYVDRHAALQRRAARPARTSSAGSTTPRRATTRRPGAQIDARQPVPGGDGARLLPPLHDRLQPRAARRGGRDQLGRALPRRRGDRARLERPSAPARALRQARARRRRRALGPVGRLPPARCSATRSTIHDAGALPGRHDALRHPRLPAAARRARRGDRADPRAGRDARVLDARSPTSARR